jgi:thymidine phosphorylase
MRSFTSNGPSPALSSSFIDALVSGDLGPEHAGAFAAAVMVNGLTDDALVALTTAMAGDSRLLSRDARRGCCRQARDRRGR